MNIYSSSQSIQFDTNSVVTVGTFDGVHAGHQKIFHRLIESAKESGARSVVVTFEPHPQIVLQKPGRDPIQLLSSIEERLQLLDKSGISDVIIVPFSTAYSQISSEDFVRKVLVQDIGLRKILVGYDHSFGKDREGDEKLLHTLGTECGFEVEIIPEFRVGDDSVSSTKIRHALLDGNLDHANAMLGYPYMVEGVVIEGHRRGHTLGIPTANVKPKNAHKLLPRNGVYFVSSMIDGQLYYGMANVGLRPTFTEDLVPTLEVHYLSMDMNLYELTVQVNFIKFIRDERKFDSVDLFLSQIVEDRNICFELVESYQHI
ncbi:MAG: bifunctional riboflavin kinase/FAD synthetase [Ignavibacteria bacterium]|nr:bifunctional riboflavin kinase/FAD synthetase [Ignavibacteria bacterium]